MLALIVRRVLLAVVSVWGVMTIVFFMSKLIPGNPAAIAAGPGATPEQIAAAERTLGLDQPVLVQYVSYLGRVLTGDLGISVTTHQSVAGDLAVALPSTLQLVILVLIVNVVVGIPLGTLAAVRRSGAVDGSIRLLVVIAGGIPVFWLALLVQFFVASKWQLLPISGSNGFGMAPPRVTGATLVDSVLAGSWPMFVDSAAHLVLPTLVLAAPFVAIVARSVRTAMSSTLAMDHIAFARAKGATTLRVVMKHGLRISLPAPINLLGQQAGYIMGSAILVEVIFAMPGIGQYLNTSIINHDTFAVLGIVLVIGIVFTVSNLIADLVQIWLNPQLRSADLTKAM